MSLSKTQKALALTGIIFIFFTSKTFASGPKDSPQHIRSCQAKVALLRASRLKTQVDEAFSEILNKVGKQNFTSEKTFEFAIVLDQQGHPVHYPYGMSWRPYHADENRQNFIVWLRENNLSKGISVGSVNEETHILIIQTTFIQFAHMVIEQMKSEHQFFTDVSLVH